MKFQRNPRGMGEFLNGPDARRVVALAAARGLAQARASVAHRSGETAASGHLQHGRGGRRNDRVRSTIVFGGAAVPLQFGNARTPATRFLTRAFLG